MSEFSTDVLVVGSGAAALVGALTARSAGLEVLVAEKTDLVGGSSAMSGGGLWIPNNPVSRQAGLEDSFEEAWKYLSNVVPEAGEATAPEKLRAFLINGPELVQFLQDMGFKWRASAGYPDYYPEKPGGSVKGRCIEGAVFNGRKLGEWRKRLRQYPGAPPLPIHTNEASKLYLTRSWAGISTLLRIGARLIGHSLLGRVPLTIGASLIGQLLYLCLKRGVQIWLKSPLKELVEEGGRVVGAVLIRETREVTVRARGGVLLAAGGFEHSQEMREAYLPRPTSTEWAVGAPGNTGDAIRAAMELGAKVALMDKAWGGPIAITPDGRPSFILAERSLPFGMIVDLNGERFMNESASYVDCWQSIYKHNREAPAIPSWLIIDQKHRSRYLFGMLMPGRTPERATSPRYLVRAHTLEELADKIGVEKEGLLRTVKRFNEMARAGRDEDFHRGESAYDRFYSDPSVKPNPNLGPIDKPPYYATAIYPGELGTLGGLLTDEHGRVLHRDGHPIAGLYAAGNTSASIFGGTYPGPGSTLGPACVYGYIAAKHIIETLKKQ
ncbi:MAG: FAD-binding protein [Nitrososphaerota archaeon]|nr:FAD-binding protein [Candidatus Calditenuaceae archaeon]MDW8072621.1 FAD-binding protein [Nitrososphaerota archaeon]